MNTLRTLYSIATAFIAVAVITQTASGQWIEVGNEEVIHHLRSVNFVNETTGYAAGWIELSSGTGGVQSIVARTSDGGRTWLFETINNVEVNAIHFVDANRGFAVGRGFHCGCPVLLRSTDGGKTWAVQEFDNLSGSFEAISFIDAARGIIGGGNNETGEGYILSTVNAWETYLYVLELEDAYVSRLDMVSPTTAYAVVGATLGDEKTILKTENLDALPTMTVWEPVHAYDGFVSISGIDFLTEDLGYTVMTVFDAGGYRGEVHRTTNGGADWTPAFVSAAFTLVALDFFDADNGFAVGAEGAIVHTTNGGADWSELVTHETQLLAWVQFVHPGLAFAVGTDGTILKYDRSLSVPSDGTDRSSPAQVRIFPNPSTSHSNVVVDDAGQERDYVLVLSDLRGREVSRVALPGGTGRVESAVLPGGVYFYRLMREGEVRASGNLIVR